LKSKRFLEENGLRIIGQTGPPSGQSTTVTFTYELLDRNTKEGESIDALSGIRGIAKELFRKLGGGDSFVRKERSNFHG
jgi:hypothetical protein